MNNTAILNFEQQKQFATQDGWLQGRYYGEEGRSVREMLSFEAVFEINPFEMGVSHRKEKAAYAKRFKKIIHLMHLGDLLERPFNGLSNGEMRRALFARVVLSNPQRLILEDPMAGLDPIQREHFKRIIQALANDGVEVKMRCRHADEKIGAKKGAAFRARETESGSGKPIIELNHINIRLGKRQLFKDFNWVVNKGERWVLRGPNGSGKTTLMALITGDSPLAYANDVRVFGVPRKPGYELAKIRNRIAAVSPEMQTFTDSTPEELLEAALKRKPELLILDEPCLNMAANDAKRVCKKIARFLKSHPTTTAICIVHREEHIPAGFTKEKVL